MPDDDGYYSPQAAAKKLRLALETAEFRLKVSQQALSLCHGNKSDAKSVLAEAFVRIAEGTRRWPAGVETEALMYQVVRSICSNMYRDRARFRFVPLPDNWEAPAREIDPDARFIDRKWSDIEAMLRVVAGDDAMLLQFGTLMTKWELSQGGGPDAIKAELNLTDADYDRLLRRLTRAAQRWHRQQQRREQ